MKGTNELAMQAQPKAHPVRNYFGVLPCCRDLCNSCWNQTCALQTCKRIHCLQHPKFRFKLLASCAAPSRKCLAHTVAGSWTLNLTNQPAKQTADHWRGSIQRGTWQIPSPVAITFDTIQKPEAGHPRERCYIYTHDSLREPQLHLAHSCCLPNRLFDLGLANKTNTRTFKRRQAAW